MKKHEFPICCGATIIAGFGPPGGEQEWPTERQLVTYLEGKKAQNQGTAFIIAILTPLQRKELGRIFRKCGFKRKAGGSNYGEELSLFVCSSVGEQGNVRWE